MHRPLACLIALVLAAAPGLAADNSTAGKGDVVLSDPAAGRTLGRVDGDAVVLQNTPTGAVGRIGKDKVLLHKDGHGNTLGKVGDRKLFCHSDSVTGITLCK